MPTPTPTKPPAAPPVMPSTFVSSLARIATLPPAASVTPVPVFPHDWAPSTMTPTAPATPAVPPAPAAVKPTIDSVCEEVMTMSFAARTIAESSTRAVAYSCRTATPTPTPTPAPPPIESEADANSTCNWLPAETQTDWSAFAPLGAGSFTCALAPTFAVVSTVITLTAPPTPTPALPPRATAMPTAFTSSLLVAVTATPRKLGSSFALTLCGPDADASLDGMF